MDGEVEEPREVSLDDLATSLREEEKRAETRATHRNVRRAKPGVGEAAKPLEGRHVDALREQFQRCLSKSGNVETCVRDGSTEEIGFAKEGEKKREEEDVGAVRQELHSERKRIAHVGREILDQIEQQVEQSESSGRLFVLDVLQQEAQHGVHSLLGHRVVQQEAQQHASALVPQRVIEGLQQQRAELVHEVVEVRKDQFALQNHAEHREGRVLTLCLRDIATNQQKQRASLVDRHLRLARN